MNIYYFQVHINLLTTATGYECDLHSDTEMVRNAGFPNAIPLVLKNKKKTKEKARIFNLEGNSEVMSWQ